MTITEIDDVSVRVAVVQRPRGYAFGALDLLQMPLVRQAHADLLDEPAFASVLARWVGRHEGELGLERLGHDGTQMRWRRPSPGAPSNN